MVQANATSAAKPAGLEQQSEHLAQSDWLGASSKKPPIVLFVDDEPEIVEELSFAFNRHGYQVYTANSGLKALEVCKAVTPDLVITDIRMPNFSGIQLIDTLAKRGEDAPVIFCMTGYGDITRGEAYDRGADAYFCKPFDVEDLLSASRRFIGLKHRLVNAADQCKFLGDRLEDSAKMEAIGVMCAQVAHEINSSACLISMCVDRVCMDGSSLVDQYQRQFDTIKKNALYITKVVNGLQTLSRNSEQDPFVHSSLPRIIHDTVAICLSRFRESDIDLRVGEIPKSACIDCRPTQISQILLNLLNNAHDAVQNLESRWVHVEYQDGDNTVTISVIDSGPGIPKEKLDQIMNPFATSKSASKGVGLGLSISRTLAEVHGGKLGIDATHPNTRFYLELPKNHEEDV